MGAALQSVGGSRRCHLRIDRRARCPWRAQTCAGNATTVGKSKTERADNVQGAFRVAKEHESDIAERRLVLIDDVLTSGATVDACARVLSRAGAGHVDVLVFARVVAAARPPI